MHFAFELVHGTLCSHRNKQHIYLVCSSIGILAPQALLLAVQVLVTFWTSCGAIWVPFAIFGGSESDQKGNQK
jgi:hypothetical protein